MESSKLHSWKLIQQIFERLKISMKLGSFFLILLSVSFVSLEANSSASPNALKIFTYEKNINSENIMVVHTFADSNCFPVLDSVSQTPSIDFYWLMNRTTYKPVNSVIKKNIHERMSAIPSENADNIFYINLKDLSEVNVDIPSTQVAVETFSNNGRCNAVGKITLGAMDGNSTIILQKIFVSAKKTINPLKPKVQSITLEGLDILSGAPKSRTYQAK